MRHLAAWIMQGRLHAGATAALLLAIGWIFALLMPLMSCMSGATVALVTLRHGFAEGLKVAGIATAMMGVFSVLAFRSTAPAVWVFCLIWLPALICAFVLRFTRSQGWTLVAVAAVAALCAGGLRAATGDVQAWWRHILDNMMKIATERGAVEGVTTQSLELASRMLNSLVAASLVVTLMLTVLLARQWQAKLYNPGGFAPEFRNLRLPRLPALIAIAMLLVALVLTQQLGVPTTSVGYAVDLLAVGICALGFHGLALAHERHWRWRLPGGWLLGLYLLLLVAPLYVILMLAAVAFADVVFDFRARTKDGSGND